MANGDKELRLQAVIAEYQYVSGLIPYYRSVETNVLSIMAVVLAALAGFVGTVNAQQGAVLDYSVQGAVISLSSWLMVLFTAIEVTALLRIKRASVYLKKYLYTRLDEIVGAKSMGFEEVRSLDLIKNEYATGAHARVSDWARGRFVTSAPIVIGMGILSMALPVIGIFVPIFANQGIEVSDAPWLALGLLGGSFGLAIGVVGFRLTGALERR
jgi:hypothetical protein